MRNKRKRKYMIEQYTGRTRTEQAILDIGGNIGALIIYTSAALRGKEVQVSLKGNATAKMIHTAVWERNFNGRTVYAGIYAELPEGNYIIWTHPSREVTVIGGQVAEVNLLNIEDIYIPSASHAHYFDLNARGCEASNLLPPRYRNRQVSAAPMGAAPLLYGDDGQIAWDELWTDFC